MSGRSLRALGVVGALVLVGLVARAADVAAPAAETAKVVKAAKDFLGTLDDKQRASVSFAFDDEKQRARWSNLPVRSVPRAGLRMGELTEAQRAAAMTLVSSAMSQRGFEKVRQIVEADAQLKNNDPAKPMFGKALFFISILGTPSEREPWMVQFGGHHLGLNITIVGEHGILTPSLTAAQPAMYQMNGKTVRPLGAENDKAFALLNALDEGQRKQAVLSFKVADLVLGPGKDGRTIQPEGLKASSMDAKQRAMLLDLVSEWAGLAADGFAAARMAEIKAGLDETWFAWSGPTECEPGQNGEAYFRVQGPKVVIEYAPQKLGGDYKMHVHTMYRDPTNDYGRGVVKK